MEVIITSKLTKAKRTLLEKIPLVKKYLKIDIRFIFLID